MGEHNIEELERQLQSAQERRRQAELDLRAARDRLNDGQLEHSGMAGHIVEGSEWPSGFGGPVNRIVVRSFADNRFHGKVLKKNGFEGIRTARVHIKGAKDLGVYLATPVTEPVEG